MKTFSFSAARKANGVPPKVIYLGDANAPAPRKTKRALPKIALHSFALPKLKLPELPAATGTKTLRNRALMLLAALAVPAMAAPGDFGALPGDARPDQTLAESDADQNAMPFEQPGMSFPGSAFFFLADPPEQNLIALPDSDALGSGAAEAGRTLGEAIDAGPAARPFFSAGGSSHLRAEECLAQAIWYEAASESVAGQRAVAQVVLNRVAHRNWPSSVCGVVYQGSSRMTGCQFSFTCDGSLRRKARGRSWDRAREIAGEALSGSVYEPIGHATHYHTLWVNPYWASSLDHVGTIGAHRFYRNRGAAGEKSAFSGRYAGIEPGVIERGRADGGDPNVSAYAPPVSESAAPARSAPAPRAATVSQYGAQATTPAPILADPSYSGVGQVREDYARAGQWKSDAARAALQADEQALAIEAAEGSGGGPDSVPAP